MERKNTLEGQGANDKRTDLLAILASILPEAKTNPVRLLDASGEKLKKLSPRQAALGIKLCGRDLALVPGGRVKVGGGGVIIQCSEADSPEVQYALKVARPSLFSEEEAERESEKAKRETLVHLPLAHENIAKNFGYGYVDEGETIIRRLPCTLIEWVEGAVPLDAYLQSKRRTISDIVDALTQACLGLDHIHSKGYIHWDVKGDNVLVSSTGSVKIMDLGNASRLRKGGVYVDAEIRESSILNLPPLLHARVIKYRDQIEQRGEKRISPNRAPVELLVGEHFWDRPWLDLYMLAREFDRCIEFVADPSSEDLTYTDEERVGRMRCRQALCGEELAEFHFLFLRTIVQRMLAARSPTNPKYYQSGAHVAACLRRLYPEYGDATLIPELRSVAQHVVRLPPGENAHWTARVQALMSTQALARLGGHRQLATAHHVFPGARHTRWEHTLGALGETIQIVRALFADRTSPLFRLEATRLDVEALMLAAILHDIGHPAFGHQLEESPAISALFHHEQFLLNLLQSILDGNTTNRDVGELETAIRQSWCVGNTSMKSLLVRVREILTGSLTDQTSRTADDDGDIRNIDKASELTAQGVTGIDAVATARRVHLEVLHSILSGQIDADKRDYLRRDGHHCGVPYANAVDRERLDQALTTVVATDAGVAHGLIGVTEKGILPLESLLIARYQMFRAVYWQHTVRSMTVMLQELVELFVVSGELGATRINEGRVTELMQMFRLLTDDQALEWLEERISTERARALARGVRGERAALYWNMAEFYGGDHFSNEGLSTGVDVYKELLARWAGSKDDAGTLSTEDGNAEGRLSEQQAIIARRRSLRTEIVRHLKKEKALAKIQISENDIILDIPLPGKDQVRGLWVAGVGSPTSTGAPISLTELTPLASGVAEAFLRSVRKARVFVSPTLGGSILKSTGGDWNEARTLVTKAVSHVVKLQMDLFL